MTHIMEATDLAKAFGKVQAVAGVTFEVQKGEILGMLGPNGAGKTSVFNLLTGVHQPDRGKILFEGEDITHLSAPKRCRKGIGRTYQIPRPFGNMTVFENLLTAATFGCGLRERFCREHVEEILELTHLMPWRNKFARTLPLLGRKRLELARGLASKPKLLLLDEIAGGLTESEAHEALAIVQEIRTRGVTIIWIEHILNMMDGVDRILALTEGKTLMCGSPKAVMSSQEVLECYLGTEEA